MLILNLKLDESFIIGDNIIIQVLAARKGYHRLGVTAPRAIPVHRSEIYERIHGHLPEISSTTEITIGEQDVN